MSENDPPKILSVQEVADLVGWSAQKTRRFLQRAGALKCSNPGVHPMGRKYYTTMGLIRAAFPEVWCEIVPEEDPEEWAP